VVRRAGAVAVEELFGQAFERATYCKDEGGRRKEEKMKRRVGNGES